MNKYIVKADVGGKEYRLLFSIAAMMELTDRFGGIAEYSDIAKGGGKKAICDVLWMFCLLANQGMIAETGNTAADNPELLTEEKIMPALVPKDIIRIKDFIFEAFNCGLETEHKETGKNEETDVVLEELEREKNLRGAAE